MIFESNINQAYLKSLRSLLIRKSKRIIFVEDSHKYFVDGKQYQSVTQVLSKYFEEFDSDGRILKCCALKVGKSEEELSAEWEAKGKTARDFGTRVHELAELYLNKFPIDYDKLEPKEQKYLRQVSKCMANRFSPDFVVIDTECLVYSEEYKIAGQIDLMLLDSNGNVALCDWKTSKVIDIIGKGSKPCLNPISHLRDTNYTKYALQLSLYSYLLEQWGLRKGHLFLIHLTEDGYKTYPVGYRKKEIEDILKAERDSNAITL